MNSVFLKLSAILWIIWGLVHTYIGFVVISSDPQTALEAIANGTDPSLLVRNYPEVVDAVVNHHGWNIAWCGIATIIGAVFIWKKSMTAIFITAIVGVLADIGYVMFLGLGGYVKFMPGTLMIILSLLAISLSFVALYFIKEKETYSISWSK